MGLWPAWLYDLDRHIASYSISHQNSNSNAIPIFTGSKSRHWQTREITMSQSSKNDVSKFKIKTIQYYLYEIFMLFVEILWFLRASFTYLYRKLRKALGCIQDVFNMCQRCLWAHFFAGFIMDWKMGLRNEIHDRHFSLINQMFMQERDIPAWTFVFGLKQCHSPTQ